MSLDIGVIELLVTLHYKGLPASTTDAGVMSFTDPPPDLSNNIVLDLWRRLVPEALDENLEGLEPGHDSPSAGTISQFAEAPELSPDEVDFDPAKSGRHFTHWWVSTLPRLHWKHESAASGSS